MLVAGAGLVLAVLALALLALALRGALLRARARVAAFARASVAAFARAYKKSGFIYFVLIFVNLPGMVSGFCWLRTGRVESDAMRETNEH